VQDGDPLLRVRVGGGVVPRGVAGQAGAVDGEVARDAAAHGAAYGSTVRQRTNVRASDSWATSAASVRSPSSRNATRYAQP
jgi:hypothetical protein